MGEYAYPGGTVIQELIWLGPTPVAVVGAIPGGATIGYIWTDHLDTPRAITNSAGQQVWQWTSAPFGDTPPNSNPSGLGNFIFNHRMAGQYFDAASGLFQNNARVYDPAIGRYLEPDPIGLTGGPNPYVYAGANPLSVVDPMGLTYGTTDCSFYTRACLAYGNPNNPSDYYCHLAPFVCNNWPNNVPGLPANFGQCVRQCLQERMSVCQPRLQCPATPDAFCNTLIHKECYFECFNDPNGDPNFPGT